MTRERRRACSEASSLAAALLVFLSRPARARFVASSRSRRSRKRRRIVGVRSHVQVQAADVVNALAASEAGRFGWRVHGGFEQNRTADILAVVSERANETRTIGAPSVPCITVAQPMHGHFAPMCTQLHVMLEDQIAYIDVPATTYFSLELVHRVVDAYLKRKIESLLMRRRRVLRADPHYAYDSRFLPVGFQKLRER